MPGILERLEGGPGVVVLRGLHAAQYSKDELRLLYGVIGKALPWLYLKAAKVTTSGTSEILAATFIQSPVAAVCRTSSRVFLKLL